MSDHRCSRILAIIMKHRSPTPASPVSKVHVSGIDAQSETHAAKSRASGVSTIRAHRRARAGTTAIP